MKKIIVTVTPTGEVSVEAKGYTGPACKSASKPFEDALGVRTGETLTPDYHRTEPTRNNNNATS